MFTAWCLIVGVLLIAIALSDTWRQELPFSTSALYLLAGYLLGPQVFALIDLDLKRDAVLLERLTEVAVLVSLFAVGLRLRAGLSDPLWSTPVILATMTMLVTIGVLMALGLAVGLTPGMALLLAAVLAPTDPVLASEVQVKHTQDHDRLRFSLTGEGGLNDGAAFPFVMLALGMLGLHELGPATLRWWGVDVLWATAAGLALGWLLGFGFSHAVVYLRGEKNQALGMESFLTLGLIALSYGLALSISAYGFLAVFASGVAMRHVERHKSPDEIAEKSPDELAAELGPDAASDSQKASAYMAKTVLEFTLDLEKIAELTVMLIIGSLLTRDAFTPTSVGIAVLLIFVVRPLAVYLTTFRLPLTPLQRRLVAWFGIRGIGSMYYLTYAIAHGVRTPEMDWVADAVLVTIVLSVLLHGSSATPIMRLYRRAKRRGQPLERPS